MWFAASLLQCFDRATFDWPTAIMVFESPQCLSPSFVKKMIFYAARDGMSKMLCSALSDRPYSEMRDILEQGSLDNGQTYENNLRFLE